MSDRVATQPRNLLLLATTEICSGGTYIVTGANTDLRIEVAKHLVALGALKVILGVRNVSNGEAAKAEIEAATGKTNIVEVWALDLAKDDSVKAFARRAVAELDRIDALIESAGVAAGQRTLAEGHVLPVTVNILNTLLLGVLLLPKMSESAQKFGNLPHIVVVSSGVSFGFEEQRDRIKDNPLVNKDDEEMVPSVTHPLSKLFEVLTVRHLASLTSLSRTGVVMSLVCPGLSMTDLSRNAPPAFRENIAIQHEKFRRTAEDGSGTLLYEAAAGKESHGCYLDSCEMGENLVLSWVTDEEGKKTQRHVWEIITNELDSIEPGCVMMIL